MPAVDADLKWVASGRHTAGSSARSQVPYSLEALNAYGQEPMIPGLTKSTGGHSQAFPSLGLGAAPYWQLPTWAAGLPLPPSGSYLLPKFLLQ